MIDLACATAGRNMSQEEWQRYFTDQPYRRTCERWPAHPSVTQSLRDATKELAAKGDIRGAIAKLEEALTLDAKLGIEPEAEAKRIYAPKVVEQGRALAEQGDIAGATAKFQEALALDPKLGIEPEAEAKRIYAPKVVEEGRAIAKQGAISGAVAKFEEALALNPDLKISAKDWNTLCWSGATWNQPALVLDACETAVKLAPNDGEIRDSRGLARALGGDIPRAIEDFTFYVNWMRAAGGRDERITTREAWIAALEAGEDPAEVFDAETLEGLRNQ